MKIGAIGIRTKIIVGDAATWYLLKKYLDNVVIKGGITPEEREKLAGIEENANDYTHPEKHPSSILDVVDVVNGAANKFLNERGEMVAVAHESLTDKNSEAAVQHIDTTVTKPALDEADKVAVKDSVTGKMVLTPKSNFVEAKPDVWYHLTLLNGWVNVSETDKASFLKDSIGVVHLRGRIKDGSAGAAGFVLPLGFYREGIPMEHPLVSGYGAYGRLLIATNGTCYINVDYNVNVDLASISFKL